jgi:N-acyl-D-amino-acid deacylase
MARSTLLLVLGGMIAIAGCAGEDRPECAGPGSGLVITNVRIVDGSGTPPFDGSVRIADGVISAVGARVACAGETVIDGGGQVLAPGLIDTHSHADRYLFEYRDALPLVSQGITTVVVGQDGGSPWPLADFFARLEATPATVNVASYAGHNTLRELVMGDDFRRAATDGEVAEMAALLEQELAAGALGLATGLEYEPGIHSDTAEVLALARVAAAAGTRYISHVRSEDRWFEDAIDEIILIGRETGMPVQVSHIKLAMKRLLGTADALVSRLDAARAGGVDITADIYPYEYWQSTIMVLLPERDYTDRGAIAEALAEIVPPDGLWMTKFDPNPEYVGKTLTEIAALRETDVITAFSQLAAEAERMEEETGESAEAIIGTSMREQDIAKLITWPHSNICTDGGIVDRHPRAYGSYPRVLGRYVREQELLTLEEAVHKMSGLAAAHMGFTDRGLIREGMAADLVLFDPATVIDRATPLEPDRLSVGISRVWVGGETVFADGAATAARPGRAVRRKTT